MLLLQCLNWLLNLVVWFVLDIFVWSISLGLDMSGDGQSNVVISKLKSILVSITSNMKFNLWFYVIQMSLSTVSSILIIYLLWTHIFLRVIVLLMWFMYLFNSLLIISFLQTVIRTRKEISLIENHIFIMALYLMLISGDLGLIHPGPRRWLFITLLMVF